MLSKGMIYVEQGDNQNAIIHLQEVLMNWQILYLGEMPVII